MVQKVTLKFTNKNGKNIVIKNFPVDAKGHETSIGLVRYNPVEGNTKNRRQKYPEVFVNGRWVNLHVHVLKVNGVVVPKGFNRHHKDMNPLNNTLENLLVVDKFQHLKLHNEHDVENGVATEYEHIYQIPSGGYKYIDLNATEAEAFRNDKIFARKVDVLVKKLHQNRICPVRA